MPCGVCKKKQKVATKKATKTAKVLTECEYTAELMVIWIDKLNCIKHNGLFDEVNSNKKRVNFAIGTVQSAINTGNTCFFQSKLDDVNDIILALISIGKC